MSTKPAGIDPQCHTAMEVSWNGATPIARWMGLFHGNIPLLKWMITGGTPMTSEMVHICLTFAGRSKTDFLSQEYCCVAAQFDWKRCVLLGLRFDRNQLGVWDSRSYPSGKGRWKNAKVMAKGLLVSARLVCSGSMKRTKLEIFVCSAFYVYRCISLSSFMDDNVSHCFFRQLRMLRLGKEATIL